MEELVKFTLINRGVSGYLSSRYSERKEAAAKLEERVGLNSIWVGMSIPTPTPWVSGCNGFTAASIATASVRRPRAKKVPRLAAPDA
jgi:hypothetical protein